MTTNFVIAVVGFDIKTGATVEASFPQPLPISSQTVSDIALPDGLHNLTKEYSFTFHKDWLICSSVQCVRDPSVERGARITAIAILSSSHPFPAFLLSISSYILHILPSAADERLSLLENVSSLLSTSFSNSSSSFSINSRLFVLPASTESFSTPMELRQAILDLGRSNLALIISTIFDPSAVVDRNICFLFPSSGYLCSIIWCLKCLFGGLESCTFLPFLPLSLFDDVIEGHNSLIFGTTNQIVTFREDVQLVFTLENNSIVLKQKKKKFRFKYSKKLSSYLINSALDGRCDSTIISYFHQKFKILTRTRAPIHNSPIIITQKQPLNSNGNNRFYDEYLDYLDSFENALFSTNNVEVVISGKNLNNLLINWALQKGNCKGHICRFLSLSRDQSFDFHSLLTLLKDVDFNELPISTISIILSILSNIPAKSLLTFVFDIGSNFYECVISLTNEDQSNHSLLRTLASLFMNIFIAIISIYLENPQNCFIYVDKLSQHSRSLFDLGISLLNSELSCQSVALDLLFILSLINNLKPGFVEISQLSAQLETIENEFVANFSYMAICDLFCLSELLTTSTVALPSKISGHIKSLSVRPSLSSIQEIKNFLLTKQYSLASLTSISKCLLPNISPTLPNTFQFSIECLLYCCCFKSIATEVIPEITKTILNTLTPVNFSSQISKILIRWFESVFSLLQFGKVVVPDIAENCIQSIAPFLHHESLVNIAIKYDWIG
ncbi:hypothetical protein P9112_006917 [Eukaryota sp. TZLM1-RC]